MQALSAFESEMQADSRVVLYPLQSKELGMRVGGTEECAGWPLAGPCVFLTGFTERGPRGNTAQNLVRGYDGPPAGDQIETTCFRKIAPRATTQETQNQESPEQGPLGFGLDGLCEADTKLDNKSITGGEAEIPRPNKTRDLYAYGLEDARPNISVDERAKEPRPDSLLYEDLLMLMPLKAAINDLAYTGLNTSPSAHL